MIRYNICLRFFATAIITASILIATPVRAELVFSECSEDKQHALNKAFNRSRTMLTAARDGVKEVARLQTASAAGHATVGGIEVNLKNLLDAYKIAFGEFDLERFKEIEERLYYLDLYTGALTTTAICDQFEYPSDGCQNKRVRNPVGPMGFRLAYVPKERQPRQIVFCTRYFGSPLSDAKKNELYEYVIEQNTDDSPVRIGSASYEEITAWHQAGTMLHEFMHWEFEIKGIAGAKDNEYGLQGVRDLAEKDPQRSVQTADAYHVFVMLGFFSAEAAQP